MSPPRPARGTSAARDASPRSGPRNHATVRSWSLILLPTRRDIRVKDAGKPDATHADFSVSVQHIVAQPFLLKASVAGSLRKHVPAHLLLTGNGPLVVDVKPQARLANPLNVVAFAWTRERVCNRSGGFGVGG